MNALPDMRDAVHDEKSFVEFLEALSIDWSAHSASLQADNHPQTSSEVSLPWQTTSIGDFLDAAVRTGDAELDSGKVFERPANHWHRVACILYGGKRYQ